MGVQNQWRMIEIGRVCLVTKGKYVNKVCTTPQHLPLECSLLVLQKFQTQTLFQYDSGNRCVREWCIHITS